MTYKDIQPLYSIEGFSFPRSEEPKNRLAASGQVSNLNIGPSNLPTPPDRIRYNSEKGKQQG